MAASKIDWHEKARLLLADKRLSNQPFINGKYVHAASGESFACISPVDGKVLTNLSACNEVDVDLAVKAARSSFENGAWSKRAPAERKTILLKLADLIESHTEELALLETLDMGKPIRYSLSVDIPAVIRCIRWYAEAIDKIYDEVAPTSRDVLATITREPMGVIGIIVPWNFPLLMAAWKFAPALAAGNSIVIKPSEKSSLTVLRVAQLASEAGIPDGVFNVVPGMGHVAGKALALHVDVDCIAFTGSTMTGKQMMQYAGQSNLKRVWLECGGKSAHIVMPDAVSNDDDLDAVANAAAAAIYFNQGEMCSAGSRLLVHESVREKMLQRIQQVSSQYQPGDPLNESTRLGAIVDELQTGKVKSYIQAGCDQGAALRFGGKQVMQSTGGFYIEPTLFDGVTPMMKIAQEEIFGPVLSVISFHDEHQAIKIANDVIYGLAAGVWTRDIDVAHRMSRALRAGVVYVNCYDEDDITVPFGGYRQSGFGRDKSLHAFDKYTELKTTWMKLRSH
ncbi:MAG TPA: aldehyde dehydrogenase [Steroidobacteraceae bacterium]|nr:aldehyde dehydrogenase [Steroidobacteraceae bacterium]